MTTKIKYLAFKGIEKKEQILFKSFLNLSKNELEYQVVILKPDHADEPDILILGEDYEFDDKELHLQKLPTILVGNDTSNDSETYIRRPVQWSDFKSALSQLEIGGINVDALDERILPGNITFAINSETDDVSAGQETISVSASAEEYDYELGKMSVDYNNFTNSEYGQVADDVEKFNKEDVDLTPSEAVILITDEESSSINSVLVIETNSNEAWDFSLSETTSISEIDRDLSLVEDDDDDDEVVLEQKVGLQIAANEEYWLEDNEIIADNQTLFYIKQARGMVYSHRDPGHWPKILQEGTLSKLPLANNWHPKKGHRGFPLNCLKWANALMFDTDDLAPDLDEDGRYVLDEWPLFDLIELDNSLLKLCTMMFVLPESVDSLMTKSNYSRATVVGLINACHSLGLIKSAEEFDQANSFSVNNSDGVLGKIKDVFR